MRALIAATALALLSTLAHAADPAACEAKAVDKNGKALAGAAKTSFIKKCAKAACETQAIDKNGKTLAGAAKKSFVNKCVTDAAKAS